MEQTKVLEVTTKLFNRTVCFCIVNASLAQLTEEDKLTEVQLICLRYVNLHPEPSVGEIAKGLAISNAAAAKLIDRLVKRKLLLREEDTQDRRVLKIILTPKGKELLDRVTTLESNYYKEILNRMEPQDIAGLQNGLTAFLKAALVNPEDASKICLSCGWEHFLDCPGNLRYRELTGKDREKV